MADFWSVYKIKNIYNHKFKSQVTAFQKSNLTFLIWYFLIDILKQDCKMAVLFSVNAQTVYYFP